MVDSLGVVKITDFGCNSILPLKKTCGLLPSTLDKLASLRKIGVYSFGITAQWTILRKKTLYTLSCPDKNEIFTVENSERMKPFAQIRSWKLQVRSSRRSICLSKAVGRRNQKRPDFKKIESTLATIFGICSCPPQMNLAWIPSSAVYSCVL